MARLRPDLPPSLHERVRALIRKDGCVEVSLGHGDLVGSNILVTDEPGVVPIDWEHARSLPIVFDVAKLHLNARDPDVVLTELREVLGSRLVAVNAYRLEEQLALAHVQMLAWHEHRAAKAIRAGRLAYLQRDSERRVSAPALVGRVSTIHVPDTTSPTKLDRSRRRIQDPAAFGPPRAPAVRHDWKATPTGSRH